MTTPETPAPIEGAPAGASLSSVFPRLSCRVVREAERETWFVVNESDTEVASIPLAIEPGRGVRRVVVNGEAAEFSAGDGNVMVRPRRVLRPGAGTLVVIQYR